MGCCKFKFGHRAKQLQNAYDLFKLVLYTVDIATDGYASYSYYLLGDTFWASMTLGLIFPAMIFTSIYCMNQRTKKRETEKRAVLLIVAICFSPFITLYFMLEAVILTVFRENNKMKKRLGFIKLTESVLESYPQSCLQMYIIFVYWQDDKAVSPWQYVTLAISLLSLTLSIAGHDMFEHSHKIIKASFIFFGSLALITRLLVSCIFSIVLKGLWLVPMGTYLAIAYAIWQIKKLDKCDPKTCLPLNERKHACELVNVPNFPIAIVVTAIFNSFTRSGLVIGTVALGFSIGGYFLVPGTLSLVTMILAAVSCLSNIIMLLIPPFKKVGKTWLSTKQVKESLKNRPSKKDEQSEHAEQVDKPEQSAEADRAGRAGHDSQTGQNNQGYQNDQVDQTDQPNQEDQSAHDNQTDQNDQANQTAEVDQNDQANKCDETDHSKTKYDNIFY